MRLVILGDGSRNIGNAFFKLVNQVWIAADVFVAPNVHIGEGTVAGARSTVLKGLPVRIIGHGNLAKPKKQRCAKNQNSAAILPV